MKNQAWRIPQETREKIAARIKEVSINEVCFEFRVAHGTVRNIRDEFGISPRPRGAPCILGTQQYAGAHGIAWPLRPRGRKSLMWATEGAA